MNLLRIILPQVRRFLPWLLILLPAVLTARLLQRYAVNIPFLDDWMFTPMYEKARGMHGGLTLHDFFIVQMEHRLAWPRLIIVALDRLFPGNFIAQCWVTYGLMGLTTVNIGLLLKRCGGEFRRWWPLLALASALIFSPVQYQILLWPMMFQVATPTAALTSALVILGTGWPLWLRFTLCVLCALAASLSIASGLLLWLLLIPVIWWSNSLPIGRPRLIFLASWLAVFLVTACLYFHNLKNETDPQFSYRAGGDEVTLGRGLKNFVQNPLKVVDFMLHFSGGHLGRGSPAPMMQTTSVVGGASVAVLLIVAVVVLCRKSDPQLRASLIPWIMLGCYTPGTGSLVALGRAWASNSGDNALQGRYVIHAIPLSLALLALVWQFARHVADRKPELRNRLCQGGFVAGGLFLGLIVLNWLHGATMMNTWASSRLRGAANTQFFKIHQPNLLNAECELCANDQSAGRLDDLGLLTPPMVKSTKLTEFDIAREELSTSTAQLENLRPLMDDTPPKFRILAEGYASLPQHERVADALLFATRVEDSGKAEWQIFHVAQIRAMPLTLRESLGRDMRFIFQEDHDLGHSLTHFAVEFHVDALPPGQKEYLVGLWALDYRKQKAYPVRGRFRLNTEEQRIIKLRQG